MGISISKSDFNKWIKDFEFKTLFIELGWDDFSAEKLFNIKGETFKLSGIAEKKGFAIFACNSAQNSKMPNKEKRKAIDKELTKLHHEHLIIYADNEKTQQIWQFSIKEPNKPIQYREFQYFANQEPELLFQKLRNLFFTLDEEDKITLIDVKLRVAEQFNQNAEKVTKKFYSEFKKRHEEFKQFIEGLENTMDVDWYASLMLNRLMFIYFIQKKGFLDGDTNYLKNKLKFVKESKGENKFYKSFYRTFLLTLFHKGLGKPQHSPELIKEIGKVPYLNGGLFDVHQLEKDNDKLDIKDEAFEKLFDFFDQYNWHLDVRPDASGKDINPDVIGYIFEKYINDRAAMGAYYTKEDITEYIAKNTIIPFLFDKTKEKVKNALLPESSLWKMLKENPDRYIYDAVKLGVPQEGDLFNDLPEEIKAGFRPDLEKQIVKETTKPHLWEIRKVWNKKALPEIALPTETYRELIERRKRYAEVKTKMLNGEITDINDFITYNLNIRQFAQDAIQHYEGSDFIQAFYKAIKEITILDPTAGSGAFLFAALNILEPLYEACIDRMREFVELDNEKGSGKKFEFFRKELAKINKHPNEKYFIYKSIILNNLYGVDIMKEAVEIAKLRLFLKLVAVVDPNPNDENYGLEPLPDIDFNIRAGNTLVGFTSFNEIKNAFEEAEASGRLLFGEERKILQNIDDKANIVADLFKEFKEQQTINNPNSLEYKETKAEVIKRLRELNELLNKYLAYQYGINADELLEQGKYKEWLNSHKPFHWFAEYYEIIHERGGFDVIIGNPPYLPINRIFYNFNKYEKKLSDVYGYIMLRVLTIISSKGNLGFIIMHNIAFSRKFTDLRETLKRDNSNKWFSFFGRIPSGLFSGDVRVRNCISIINKSSNSTHTNSYTTNIHRWFVKQRELLFPSLHYAKLEIKNTIPRYYNNNLARFYQNQQSEQLYSFFSSNTIYKLFYKKTAYNWLSVTNRIPPCYDEKGNNIPQTQINSFSLPNEIIQKIMELLFNGKLFFSYWLTFGDEFHVTQDLFNSFRLPLRKIMVEKSKELLEIHHQFDINLDKTIQYKFNAGINVGTFNTTKLWGITDKSDLLFLSYLTKNVNDVFEDINNHVLKTIMTDNID